jgi:hypothetical protein
VVNFFEADVVASEEAADGDAVAVPAEATVGADESSLEVAGVGDGVELVGKGSRGGMVEVGGQCAVEGLVRAHGVVMRAERAEGTLLGAHVGPRRSSGSALEDEMHVLVLAVLVG